MITPAYFTPLLPNWELADFDEENIYIEFLGYNEEFILSISYEPEQNRMYPFSVLFSQYKGSYSRFDYEKFDLDSRAQTLEEAADLAMEIMEKVNLNYHLFLPVTNRCYVSLGPEIEYDRILKLFGGELKIAYCNGQPMVHIHVDYLNGLSQISQAIELVEKYIQKFDVDKSQFNGGKITNEKFQFIAQVAFEGTVWDNENLSLANELDPKDIHKYVSLK